MVEQTRLFVGNLPANTSADEINDLFSYYGQVIATDLKLKTDAAQKNTGKGFAFVTLETDADNVDMCIQEFSHEEWKGTKLYVTRARENFMDRLKKERAETEAKKSSNNAIREVTGTNTNPLKMKMKQERTTEESFDFKKTKFDDNSHNYVIEKQTDFVSILKEKNKLKIPQINDNSSGAFEKSMEKKVETRQLNGKQADADSKRLESMRNMRKSFNEKKSLIKQGLASVDKRMNKKIVFSDNDNEYSGTNKSSTTGYQEHKTTTNEEGKRGYKMTLFDGEESDNEEDVSFRVKEQFEGKSGQKLLGLQTRYKADKRFTLDARFADAEDRDENNVEEFESEADKGGHTEDRIELADDNEKIKQMNILQGVLGISIKSYIPNAVNDSSHKKNASSRLGMLRYDPSRPEHEKFVAPTDSAKSQLVKKSKKERKTEREEHKLEELKSIEHTERTHPAIEVSKETFYKVSDTLKDAMGQPKEFSLRSLFSKEPQDDTYENDARVSEEIVNIAPYSKRKEKVKNPLDATDRNPFKYDSSDSEPDEDDVGQTEIQQEKGEDVERLDGAAPKAVWSENFFFTADDVRLIDGLSFFMNTDLNTDTKDRRQLKFVMKKRLQNSARNDKMFKRKIGGKRRQNVNSKNNFKSANRRRN